MAQSRLMSLIESATNVIVGLGLAVITQLLIFPLYGLHLDLTDNLRIALVFTGISLLRGYALRRVFVHFGART